MEESSATRFASFPSYSSEAEARTVQATYAEGVTTSVSYDPTDPHVQFWSPVPQRHQLARTDRSAQRHGVCARIHGPDPEHRAPQGAQEPRRVAPRIYLRVFDSFAK